MLFHSLNSVNSSHQDIFRVHVNQDNRILLNIGRAILLDFLSGMGQSALSSLVHVYIVINTLAEYVPERLRDTISRTYQRSGYAHGKQQDIKMVSGDKPGSMPGMFWLLHGSTSRQTGSYGVCPCRL